MTNKLSEFMTFTGSSLAKGLSGIDHEDWQDASNSLEDFALQAAVADGVVSFVHAAAGMQDKLKQEAVTGTEGGASSAQDTVTEQAQQMTSKENKVPAVAAENSTDDVECLDLE